MKKIFSIVVSALFLILQNSAPLLAASTASNWAQLYNNLYTNKENSTLTMDITKAAGDSTIPITGSVGLYINGGYNISAISGTLFSIGNANSLNLATGGSVSGAIVNDGTLFTTNLYSLSGGVSGLGNIYNTASLTTYNTIAQNYVENTGTLTSNGTMNLTLFINNTGHMFTNNGTLNSDTFNNYGSTVNNGTITSDSIYTNDYLISDADALSGNITNNSWLELTGGTNENTIYNSYGDTSQGIVIFRNDSQNDAHIVQNQVSNRGFLDNNSEISVVEFSNTTSSILNNNALITASTRFSNSGTINTNANLLDGTIVNDGVVNFEGGTNRNTITNSGGNTSTGKVNFTGNMTNNAAVTQNTVTNTGTLTNNAVITAAKVSNTNLLANNSTISGSLQNTGVITSTGTLSLSGTSSNSGTIEQANLSNNGTFTNSGSVELTGALTNDGTLTSRADTIVAASGIINSGTLSLTGGVNDNNVSGPGTIYISGDSVNNATIYQNIINNSGALVNNDSLDATTLTNSGTLNNKNSIAAASASNTGTINSAVTGISILSFANNGTVNLNGAGVLGATGDVITGAGNINFSGSGAGITNNTTITQTNITNNGILTNTAELLATGTLTNTNTLSSSNSLTAANIVNSGQITSTDQIVAQVLLNSGEINIDAEDLYASSFTNTGTLTLTGSGDFGTDGVAMGGNGTVFFNSSSTAITNNTTINQANVINYNLLENENVINAAYFENTGTLDNIGVITASALINSGIINSYTQGLSSSSISNNGTITLYGSGAFGTSGSALTGNGTLQFGNSSSYITNNTVIAQSTVNNSVTLTNNAVIVASNINNDGTVYNNASITTADLSNDGYFTTAVNNLTADSIENDGTLTLTGEGNFGTSGNDVNGNGTLTFNGDIINNTEIEQGTVNNLGTLDNKAIISAEDIVNSGNMTSEVEDLSFDAFTNTGSLLLTGAGDFGSSGSTVQGAGTLTFEEGGTITNNASIIQDTITNNTYLLNNGYLQATNVLNNNASLTTDASNLEGNVVNNLALIYTGGTQSSDTYVSGAGNVFIEGGDTTFEGSNTYTGVTYLTDNLSIETSSNIGTGAIFFNGGALNVTGETALTNYLTSSSGNNIVIENDDTLTLQGMINTQEDFVKNGFGDLLFGMNSNTYNNTYVNTGLLSGYTYNINGTVDVAGGAEVEFKDTENNTLNTITGSGLITKSGDSLTDITNDVSAATFNVDAGKITVNTDNYYVDTTNIASSATLGGNGIITGDVNVLGTLEPGNSVDTLTIDGDLDLASGSTTAIEITNTPADAADKTVVSGDATINNGAILTAENIGTDRFFEWKTFNILESSGTLSGAYDYDGSIDGYDSSRLNGEAAYDYTNGIVSLLIKRNATDYVTSVSGKSHNQAQVAKIVDNITATSLMGDITNPLLQLEALAGLAPAGITPAAGSTINSALADMDGVLYANTALTSLFNAKSAHIYDRISSRTAAPKEGCPACFDNVWSQYYSQYNKVYGDANSPRFTNNVTGVMAGYDRYSQDSGFMLGAFGGGSKTDLRQNSDTMDINDVTVGAYGGYLGEDWTFKGVLYLGHQDFKGNRHITFMDRDAKASYSGHNIALDLEAAYNLYAFDNIKIKPFVGLLNAYSHQQHFNETGADSLNLYVDSNDAYNVQARLGAQADGKYRKLNWYANLAVKQFLGNDYDRINATLSLPNTGMNIISAKLGGTYFSSGIGLNYTLTQNLNIFANGEAGTGSKSANCYGNIGLAYAW